ncbi:MAG TPA: O-antigen ligase family protein [Candidatus Saccharimonadales bacterium]|jgi:O-antigen ligase|nr:O-antigen ligase family protein [Candidatus Saccharimonadales bacterium]
MDHSVQQPECDANDYRVVVTALCILVLIVAMLLVQVSAAGEEGTVYYGLSLVMLLGSLVFLLRPFVSLTLVLVYLISPLPALLDLKYSAAITALMIGNCAAGSLLAAGFRVPLEGRVLRALMLVGCLACFTGAYGAWRGNQASLLLGDVYQLGEFAAMFFLARNLVKSERQFRALANVIVGATVSVAVLQIADALRGASYLPRLEQHGINIARTISMTAPISFVVLLAMLAVAKHKKWILAGMGILAVNLLGSFTRGLWLATAASSVFLLILQGGKFRRTVLRYVFTACVVAAPLLYVTGLGSIIGDRIGYSAQQFRSASEEDQNLSGRRLLEYILVLPRIAEHPIMGSGLGATFAIAGDAVIGGAKGEQIDFHYIHDLYLAIAYRLGIPALLILFISLWKYFRRAIDKLRKPGLSPESAALMAGLIAAVFGEVVLSLTSPTLLNHPTAGLSACMMAVTTAKFRRKARVNDPGPQDVSEFGSS